MSELGRRGCVPVILQAWALWRGPAGPMPICTFCGQEKHYVEAVGIAVSLLSCFCKPHLIELSECMIENGRYFWCDKLGIVGKEAFFLPPPLLGKLWNEGLNNKHWLELLAVLPCFNFQNESVVCILSRVFSFLSAFLLWVSITPTSRKVLGGDLLTHDVTAAGWDRTQWVLNLCSQNHHLWGLRISAPSLLVEPDAVSVCLQRVRPRFLTGMKVYVCVYMR